MPYLSARALERYTVRPSSSASSDPAANTEHSITVPAGQIWDLLSLNFSLVTDGNAANRTVTVTIDDGTTVYAKATTPVTQAASLTYNYTFGIGSALMTAVAGLNVTVPLPVLSLMPGHRIKTVTTNIQATDNYGVCEIYAVRYLP